MISSQSATRTFICFIVPIHAGGIESVATIRQNLELSIEALHDTVRWQLDDVTIVTAIGESLSNHIGLQTSILQQLDDVKVLGFTQGASQCSLSVIINPDDAPLVVEKIHALIIQ